MAGFSLYFSSLFVIISTVCFFDGLASWTDGRTDSLDEGIFRAMDGRMDGFQFDVR